MTKQDYQYFLKEDFSNYAGKWIAICNRKVVASSRSPAKVMKEAKVKCKNKKPIYTRIPKKNQTLIL